MFGLKVDTKVVHKLLGFLDESKIVYHVWNADDLLRAEDFRLVVEVDFDSRYAFDKARDWLKSQTVDNDA